MAPPKRRALIIGCNYENNKDATLKGCINDALEMKKLLVDLGYDVKTLLDSAASRRNMMAALLELRNWTHVEAGNVEIVVHYSGHGSQTVDLSGDEVDGMDEVLVPWDFELSGTISDDWLWNTMSHAHCESKWFFVYDCCHSGTVMDMIKSEHVPRMYSLSGCMDLQTSADAAFTANGCRVWGGALTTALLSCLEDVEATQVRCDARKIKDWVSNYVSKEGFSQRPQLSSTRDDMSIGFFDLIT